MDRGPVAVLTHVFKYLQDLPINACGQLGNERAMHNDREDSRNN